jgi:hypothetical protein
VRKQFHAYYPLTMGELDELWESALVVPDTNALLNLYRYSNATRSAFLDILDRVHDRLWLPHQVGLEFHERRLDLINHKSKTLTNLDAALAKSIATLEGEIDKNRSGLFIDKEQVLKAFRVGVEGAKQVLTGVRESPELTAAPTISNDAILDRLTLLFDDKVGSGYGESDAEALRIEGKKRYDDKIPPGYKDNSKEGDRKFGDLFIWKQILDHAAADKRSVLFITDDRKEDWWADRSGETTGPRLELIQEFHSRVGVNVHFYTPEQFSKHANTRYGLGTTENALEEVEAVSRDRQHYDLQHEMLQMRAQLEGIERNLEERIHRQERGVAREKRAHEALVEELGSERANLEARMHLHTMESNALAASYAERGEDPRGSFEYRYFETELERLREEARAVEGRLVSAISFLRADSPELAEVRSTRDELDLIRKQIKDINDAMMDRFMRAP